MRYTQVGRLATLSLALALLVHTTQAAAKPTVNLFLLPHTHADVGWLETVDALSRVQCSLQAVG